MNPQRTPGRDTVGVIFSSTFNDRPSTAPRMESVTSTIYSVELLFMTTFVRRVKILKRKSHLFQRNQKRIAMTVLAQGCAVCNMQMKMCCVELTVLNTTKVCFSDVIKK